MIERISGFLFLQIIVILFIADSRFGYKTFGDEDLDTKLQEINKDPVMFKNGLMLVLIEHFTIVLLAITLFIAFSPYNLLLGIVWTVSRIGEALIQIYDKKGYWGLLDIAKKYSDTSGTEKEAIFELGSSILKLEAIDFSFAQILFSVGTFAYSTLFVFYGVVPAFIGWFGIIASIIYGLGNIVFRVKPEIIGLWNIGGLLILIFEFILGVWLLIFGII